MINVEEIREIMPVTFGAMAIAFNLVIWHLGSDKETIGLLLFAFVKLST